MGESYSETTETRIDMNWTLAADQKPENKQQVLINMGGNFFAIAIFDQPDHCFRSNDTNGRRDYPEGTPGLWWTPLVPPPQ